MANLSTQPEKLLETLLATTTGKPETDALLLSAANCVAEKTDLVGRLARLEAAAQFALDFYTMETRQFVEKYGAGVTTRDVARSLREALG